MLAVQLATRTEGLATAAAEAAERRRKAGDITDLDVNLAKLAVGRAYSAFYVAQSSLSDAHSRLAVLVGAGPQDDLELVGELKPAELDLVAMRAAATQRADIKAATAEAAEARAEGALAAANGRPDLGVWFGYQIDEGDSIFLGGISFTLPAWNRQQGGKAVARAKEKRAEQESAALAATVVRQVDDLYVAMSNAESSVVTYEEQVLPLLDDSEALLQKTVEAGQIAISDYLVARQQTLDARREYLDRLLLFAKAAAKARYVAGVAR
jgi:outer membrane protein TolC